jgi:hypothetical protein
MRAIADVGVSRLARQPLLPGSQTIAHLPSYQVQEKSRLELRRCQRGSKSYFYLTPSSSPRRSHRAGKAVAGEGI